MKRVDDMSWSEQAIYGTAEESCRKLDVGGCDQEDLPRLCPTCWARRYLMTEGNVDTVESFCVAEIVTGIFEDDVQ